MQHTLAAQRLIWISERARETQSHGHRWHVPNFGEDRGLYIVLEICSQTDRQTDIHIAILRTLPGRSKMACGRRLTCIPPSRVTCKTDGVKFDCHAIRLISPWLRPPRGVVAIGCVPHARPSAKREIRGRFMSDVIFSSRVRPVFIFCSKTRDSRLSGHEKATRKGVCSN